MTAPARMFDEWLRDHARGTLNDEATAALADVVDAVAHLEKAGKVTLELTVEPAGSNGRTVVIFGRVKTKAPEAAPEASIFYVGDGGSLHRDDPYAQRLPGMAAPVEPDGEVRRVDPETGEVRRLDEEG